MESATPVRIKNEFTTGYSRSVQMLFFSESLWGKTSRVGAEEPRVFGTPTSTARHFLSHFNQ